MGVAPGDAILGAPDPHLADRLRVQRGGRGHGALHHRLLPLHPVQHVRGPGLHPAHPPVQRRLQPQQVLGDRDVPRALRGVAGARERDQHIHPDHLPGQQRHGAAARPCVPGVCGVCAELCNDG